MKFLAVAALVGAAAASLARGNVTYTTEVVTAYTTYCPAPTTLTYSDKTYTITEATTLTITDCPCTVSKPVTTSTVTACNTCGVASSAPVNGTATYAHPTGGYTTTTAAPKQTTTTAVTAGAGKVGLSLAAIIAAVAAL